MAITATIRAMDARRESERKLSSSNSMIIVDHGEADEASESSTKNAISPCQQQQQCPVCPYCSDTCGDAVTCGTALPSYTMCQIRSHNTAQSCWLVAGDNVYDATEYLALHPGGERSILKKSGGVYDCTEDIHFHSKKGKLVWNKYRIGKIRKCPGPRGTAANGEDRQWWMFWL
jgi:cytochrome b involved in lipid metabolism